MESKPDMMSADQGRSLEFALSVAKGLESFPRRLECRYIYDDHGSRLFERICEQPEYYLTRAERDILLDAADDIAKLTGEASLIEFGSGNSAKTRILLDAYARRYGSVHYVPVDVSDVILEQAKCELAETSPAARVEPFHGTYDEAFHLFESFSPLMFLFLGSNVGNLNIAEAVDFWGRISDNLRKGDYCLLGIDITDDVDILHAAYNDAAGYSAEFTRNIFARMNREWGASIDTDFIEHVARYNEEREQVEIFAKFNRTQELNIAPLGRSVVLKKNELVLTEISRKFRLEKIVPYLELFGLRTRKVFIGESSRFAVLLLAKA